MTTSLAQLGPGFASTLVRLGLQSGIDPKGAAALMLNESGLSPSIVNSIGCVGLNQLCKEEYGAFAPLTLAQYRALSAAQQLPYVFRFWNGLNRKGQTFLNGRDLYWLNWLPALFVPGAPDSYVIARAGSSYYNGNKGLDVGGKGYITAGDLWLVIQRAMASHPALWAQLSAAIGGAEVQAGLVTFGAVAVAGAAAGAVAVAMWKRRAA